MRWLVDGMNLIGSRPDGWWRDRAAARQRLMTELARFAAPAPADAAPPTGPPTAAVTVVFDGRGSPDEVSAGAALGLTVVFAPGGPDAADHVIAGMVRLLDDPEGTTVVTSDAALARRVRASGAVVMGVGTFARLLGTPTG